MIHRVTLVGWICGFGCPRPGEHRIVARMTDGPELSLEEFAQLVTGPNRFVMDWVGDVLAARVEAVWDAMARDFRQSFAQMWVAADPRAEGEDRDLLVDRLLGESDRLFRAMRADVVRSIRKSFGDGPFDDLGVG